MVKSTHRYLRCVMCILIISRCVQQWQTSHKNHIVTLHIFIQMFQSIRIPFQEDSFQSHSSESDFYSLSFDFLFFRIVMLLCSTSNINCLPLFLLMFICILLVAAAPQTVHRLPDDNVYTMYTSYLTDFQRSLAAATPAICCSRDPRIWATFYQHTLIALGLRVGHETRVIGQQHLQRNVALAFATVSCANDFPALRGALNAVWSQIDNHWCYTTSIVDMTKDLITPLQQHGADLVADAFCDGAAVTTAKSWRMVMVYEVAVHVNLTQCQAQTEWRLRQAFRKFDNDAKQVIARQQSLVQTKQTVMKLLAQMVSDVCSALEDFSQRALTIHGSVDDRIASESGFQL